MVWAGIGAKNLTREDLYLWRHLGCSFSFVPIVLTFTADDFCSLLPWLLLRTSQPPLEPHKLRDVTRRTVMVNPWLTRAPLGYFYNAPHGGGGISSPLPPLISETTGPILKIQAAFESPGKLSIKETNFNDLGAGLCSTHFFRADSTLTHMTIQVTQFRLNSNSKFANLTQLRLNSKPNFTNLTQLWLNSFESELSQIWLTTHHILPM